MPNLFGPEHELEFKRSFVIQFLAAKEAVNYQDNCNRGWKGYKFGVEDAEFLADKAWDEWKEIIGIDEPKNVLEQLQERHEYCLDMEMHCYRSNEPKIAKHWGIKASECEKAIEIVTGKPPSEEAEEEEEECKD